MTSSGCDLFCNNEKPSILFLPKLHSVDGLDVHNYRTKPHPMPFYVPLRCDMHPNKLACTQTRRGGSGVAAQDGGRSRRPRFMCRAARLLNAAQKMRNRSLESVKKARTEDEMAFRNSLEGMLATRLYPLTQLNCTELFYFHLEISVVR